MSEITGQDEARKAVLANMTPRARWLDRLERYVEGTQYDGRPSFWTDGVPVTDRAPCLVYKIVAAAIASNVDLVLGEGRYPEATTHPGEDDEEFDDSGLDEESSETIDRGIVEVARQTRLRAVAREALAQAQACGTAVAICGVRAGGRLFIDTARAKWCERELDLEGRVTRLVIQYPYTVTEKQRDGSWATKAKLYRRVIDAQRDVTMLPADARTDDAEIKWVEDTTQTFEHKLGFCPVVWYAHMRGCVSIDEIDGRAIHALSLSEIEGHDLALSMRHRAAVYGGDPTLCEFGVEPGYNPAATGRAPGLPATPAGGKMTSTNQPTGQYLPAQTGPARKKGISQTWQYEDDKARAEYLVLPPDAVKVLDEDAHDLRQKIAEALAVVFMDPENVKFAATVSGKALETLRERQLNRCDQIRDDFGDGFLVPVTCMLLRIVRVTVRSGAALRLAGAAKVAELLQRFETEGAPAVAEGAPAVVHWTDPNITLRWGDYFKPDAADEQQIITGVVAARTAKIITRRTAVEKIQRIFNIENIDQAVDTLEAEADEHGSLESAVKAMASPKGEDEDEDEDEET